MSRTQKLRVLSYDVTDDKKRRRVARLLEDRATRVQYSVFEGRFTEAALAKLVAELKDAMDTSDSLRVYTIGSYGEAHSFVAGSGIPVDRDAGYWLL